MSPEETEELYFLRMERAVERGVRAGLDEHIRNMHVPLDDALRTAREDRVSLKTLAWAGALGAGMIALLQFLTVAEQ